MLQISIKNFRSLGNIEFSEDRPLSIIVGMNESGKSSFLQAIRFACTGEAYGHRGKDLQPLIRYGETSMAVSVECSPLSATRTQAQGTTQKSVAENLGITSDLLPLLFDATVCGDGGSKHLKAFFSQSGEGAFRPGVVFQNDAKVAPCIAAAMKVGNITTKRMITYCEEQRAASREPSKPLMPGTPRPSNAAVEEARRQLTAAQATHLGILDNRKALTATGQYLRQIAHYLAAMENYQVACKAAAAGDPLGETRRPRELAAALDASPLERMATVLNNAGYSQTGHLLLQAAAAVRASIAEAVKILKDNPPPALRPPEPALPQEAMSLFRELSARSNGTIDPIELGQRASAVALAEAKAQTDVELARAAVTSAENNLAVLQQSLGAWASYDRAVAIYDDQKQKAIEAWDRWDYAVKSIVAAEAEFLAKSSAQFAELITLFTSEILQGRSVRIDDQAEIWIGPTNIRDCSVSTRWRAEVAIMTAIATTLHSPILLIDGADVLDHINRQTVLQFLITKVVPRFKHVVLTATASRPLSEEPRPPAELTLLHKYILSDGKLSLLPPLAPQQPPLFPSHPAA